MFRVAALMSVVLLACTEPEPPSGPYVTSRVEGKWGVPIVQYSAELDLLIVVDRSPAMAEYRDAVVAQAAQLADSLLTHSWGSPSLHVGVVTSDLGAEGVAGCNADGDGGRLRSVPTISEPFVADTAAADSTRVRNYQGTFADALGSLLDVPASTCSRSQPLEAVRRALENTVENAGFRRERAYFAVLIVSAQDDVSTVPVEELAAYVQSNRTLGVGAVIAPADDETCAAAPAPRLRAFLQQFPNHAAEASICGPAPFDAFELFTRFQSTLGGPPCWESPLFDADPDATGLQPACSATYRFSDGTEGVLPACTDDDVLCWRLVEDPGYCSSPTAGLYYEVDPGGRYYPGRPTSSIECVVADGM